MALSNIFNEPQREITESVIGIAVFAVVCIVWFFLADLAAVATWNPEFIDSGNRSVCPYPLWVFFWMFLIGVGTAVGLLLGIVLVLLTHRIGEDTCDLLCAMGVDPRPKLRRREELNYRTGEVRVTWRE